MKIVSCYPNGFPIDEEYLKSPRIFDGVELLVFDNEEEKKEYLLIKYPPPTENTEDPIGQ